MKKIALILNLMFWAISNLSLAQSSFKQDFEAKSRYLKIPIKNGAKIRNVDISINGVKVRWFKVGLAENKPDWYAYLDISDWKGSILTLEVDTLLDQSNAFKPILQADKDESDNDYQESLRAQFHFSPKRGWSNDPNGMAYFNGEYHLFFQHNPYGTNWGNMHWGHAVSKDLVHWKEFDDALYPDNDGTMFSGGGVVDNKNTSGLGNSVNKPLVLFYTAAEKSWEQGLAYSLDGRTFTKLHHTVLPKITDGNRDPKVIWHEPSNKWVMVLYVTESDDQHTMHFFNSENLIDWVFTSKIIGGKGNDRYLYECPEFFELAVDGNPNNKKWILTGANSQYAIGTFDGKTFLPEIERLYSQVGRDYYAAQTFDNEPKGRRIEIGWWRTHTNKDASSFNQGMSIPNEIKLRTTADGLRLVRQPVEELQILREKRTTVNSSRINSKTPNPLESLKGELAEINLNIFPKKAKSIQLNLRGLNIHYDVLSQELEIDKVKANVPLRNGQLRFQIFIDRTGVELFANYGEIFMPINYNLDSNNLNYSLKVEGGEAQLDKVEFFNLKSIWK